MNQANLKIYGERNTGTNYLQKLIELNFNVDLLPGVVPRNVSLLQKYFPGKEYIKDIYFRLTYSQNLGWKHSFVKPAEQLHSYKICSRNLSFVTLTKNPYSWLLSLYKRPYHQYYKEKLDFFTFLTTPWQMTGRENYPEQILNPIELWNRKNASYLSLGSYFPALNIKFEDLLGTPNQILSLIGKTFNYDWKVENFVNYDESTKGENKDSNFYRDYYLNNKWKEKLSSQDVTIINENVDLDIMNHFGYEKL